MRLLALFLLAMPVYATSPTKNQNDAPVAFSDANAAQGQTQTSAVAVDSGTSFGVILGGGGGSGSDTTAPCMERRPSWIFGARGDRTKLNAQCWNEYLRQAEHAREVELARLEIERMLAEAELQKAAADRLRAEACFEECLQK